MTVVCDPASPVRGTDVSCKISVVPAAAFTVVGLAASTDSVSIVYPTLPQIVGVGESLVWSGTAALTSNLTAEVQVEGQVGTLSGHGGFSVTPRTWTPWTAPLPVEQDKLSPDGKMSLEPIRYLEDFEEKVKWRMGEFVPTVRTFADPTWTSITTVDAGPNTGVSFYAEWPAIGSDTVFINPQLTGGYVGNWYRTLVYGGVDQNNANLPYCGQAQVPNLLEATRDHEGVTLRADSHWGDLNSLVSTSHIESQVEALTSHGAAGKVLLPGLADGLYFALVLKPYEELSNVRDSPASYLAVLKAASCSPLRP